MKSPIVKKINGYYHFLNHYILSTWILNLKSWLFLYFMESNSIEYKFW